MADVEDPAQRLNDLLDAQEVRIATVFRTAIAALKSDLDLSALADLIQQGQLEQALGQLIVAAEALGNASTVAFMAAGQSTSQFLLAANVGSVGFNVINDRAVAQMQANRLELVREFTNEQRKATSAAIIGGIESGANPIAQARDFRDSIGLTNKQWEHVASYRAALETAHTDANAAANAVGRALRDKRSDAQVARAARDAKALPPEKIDAMVERYAARYIKHRAEVIGRTEALRSVHQGNEEGYQQAIDRGDIDPAKLSRKWVTRLDGHERPTHHLLAGVKKGWGEAWVTKNGPIRYPGDPQASAAETIQCRCAITTRLSTR